MTRAEKRIATTAHHEAGHAVMGVLSGMLFDEVNIMPDDRRRGAVIGCRAPDMPFPGLCPTCRDMVARDKELLMILAGPVAERRFTGARGRLREFEDIMAGKHTDYSRALRLSSDVLRFNPHLPVTHAEAVIVDAHIRFNETRVKWILEDRDGAGWKAVDALAVALLGRKVLTFTEAFEVINPVLFPVSSLREAA